MKLAVTGCNGRVGRRVVLFALKQGHSIVGIDRTDVPASEFKARPEVTFLQVDLRNYVDALAALRGCEGVIQLAAYPNPGDYETIVHNSNVVITWNILRASAELGITRVAQASSVNVIRGVYSKQPEFHYFPIDEDHPCLPDEPYGLSKLICELQADTIIRRYPFMRIASLRLHWSVPNRARAKRLNPERAKGDLWGWVQEDSSAEAFILAVAGDNAKWSGHEKFLIAAPETAEDEDTKILIEKYWPDVPIKEGRDFSGRQGIVNCEKAEQLLGWVHRDYSLVE